MTNPAKPVLSPDTIDSLCMIFDSRKSLVEEAQEKLSTAKGDLMEAVQNQGYMPSHAPKTKRLEGVIYIADATTGSTLEIDEARVAELEAELSRKKLPKVFTDLFERTVKHSLRKDAAGTLKLAIGGMSKDQQSRLLSLFSSCFDVNTKAPSLSVNLASALREKEAAAAEKEAKKREREAKKAAKSKKVAA